MKAALPPEGRWPLPSRQVLLWAGGGRRAWLGFHSEELPGSPARLRLCTATKAGIPGSSAGPAGSESPAAGSGLGVGRRRAWGAAAKPPPLPRRRLRQSGREGLSGPAQFSPHAQRRRRPGQDRALRGRPAGRPASSPSGSSSRGSGRGWPARRPSAATERGAVGAAARRRPQGLPQPSPDGSPSGARSRLCQRGRRGPPALRGRLRRPRRGPVESSPARPPRPTAAFPLQNAPSALPEVGRGLANRSSHRAAPARCLLAGPLRGLPRLPWPQSPTPAAGRKGGGRVASLPTPPSLPPFPRPSLAWPGLGRARSAKLRGWSWSGGALAGAAAIQGAAGI